MTKWSSVQRSSMAPILRYGSLTPFSIDKRYLTIAQIAKQLRCSTTDVWHRLQDFDEQWRRQSSVIYRPARQGKRGYNAEKSNTKGITPE